MFFDLKIIVFSVSLWYNDLKIPEGRKSMELKENFRSISDRKVRNFVFLQIFYNGMVAILTLFINTFLLESYGSASFEVLFYNLIQAIITPVAMITSFALSRKKSFIFTQRMGFLFYGVALAVLCIWGDKVAFLYPLFAVLISFGAGYYFGIYSVQTIAYTTDDNRDLVQGVMSAICSIVSLVLPLIAGYLIKVCGEFTGYRIVFGIEALIAFGALFITTRLSPIGKNERKVSFFHIFKTIVKDKNGLKIMIANGFDNCRSFTISFYITILIYRFIDDAFLVGLNSSIGSIVAILGAAIYGVIVNKRNRLRSILVSVILVLSVCTVMYFSLNVYVLIAFYAAYSMTSIYMATPVLNTHFKVMESFREFRGMGAQVHAVREIFVTVGRIIGILMILLIPQTTLGVVITLSVIMSMPAVNALLVRSIEKNME